MVLWPFYVITCVTWGITFDEMPVLLDCCIIGLCHPINTNYVFKTILLVVSEIEFCFIVKLTRDAACEGLDESDRASAESESILLVYRK